MSKRPSAAQNDWRLRAKLVDLTHRVLVGELWECAKLSKRDRCYRGRAGCDESPGPVALPLGLCCADWREEGRID